MNEARESLLWPALLKVQGEIGNLARSAENPFFKSSYVPLDKLLDAVRPVLTAHGIVLTQAVRTGIAGNPVLVTALTLAETCEVMQDDYYLPKMDDPQKLGSAVTYARRYGLKALLGIAEEDDDGNKAASGGSAPGGVRTPQPQQGGQGRPPAPRSPLVGIENKPLPPKPPGSGSKGKGGPFRGAECPACHALAVIKGKPEFGGGWLCWKKEGGCGAKYTEQIWSMVRHPDADTGTNYPDKKEADSMIEGEEPPIPADNDLPF